MGIRKRKSSGKCRAAAAVLALALFGAPAAVRAETVGSITLLLEEGISPEGIRFSCTRVGDVFQGRYRLEDSYRQAGIDPDQLENSAEMRQAAERLSVLAEEGEEASPDGEGRILFSGLEPGLYLLKAEDTGGYRAADPALAAIPSWQEEEGTMAYDITVVPKFRPYEPEKRTLFDTGTESRLPLCLAGAGGSLLALFLVNRKPARKR